MDGGGATGGSSGRAWVFAAFGAAGGAALALGAAYMIAPPPDLASLPPRLDALEASTLAAADERRALADRLAAAEAALRPATEARVARLPADAFPLAALSLRQRLDSGAPYAAELAALERLGASAADLDPLRPFAAPGAPTRAALLRQARALIAPPAENRVLAALRGLVGRKAGESHEAEAIEAALARDDLAGAAAALRALPPEPRHEAWARAAQAWLKADAAAEGLVAGAVAGR